MTIAACRKAEASDFFLDTRAAAALARWDEVLRAQTELLLPAEIGWLAQAPTWLKARRVLDVGCGNGAYLAELKRFFPDKQYHGVDISGELVGLAHRRHPDLDIVHADFLSLEPQTDFDVVILRFVLQHLRDASRVMAQASRLLAPAGSVLIVEPNDAISGNMPDTPEFARMLSRHKASTAARGLLRTRLECLADIVASGGDWKVTGQANLVVTSLGPLDECSVATVYNGWIDLCEGGGSFNFPFDAARQEIAVWAAQNSCVSRIGLRIVHAEPIQ